MPRKLTGKSKYVFKRYSYIYKDLFKLEKLKLYKKLFTYHVAIEHVGSTAVPGLGGKNILDIMVGRKGRTSAKKLKRALEELGYQFVADSGTKERLFFVRDTIYRKRWVRIHLHMVRFNGKDWVEKIAFRDLLRKNRELMLKYARIKRRAARLANGNKEIYMREKEKFIDEVTNRALASRRK